MNFLRFHASMTTIRTQISTTVYSQTPIHTSEWTGAMQIEQSCPRFDTAARDSNANSLSREPEALATAPLRHCATAPLRHCATAPLRHCATAPLRHCATAPLRRCATAPLRPSATAPQRHFSLLRILNYILNSTLSSSIKRQTVHTQLPWFISHKTLQHYTKYTKTLELLVS